MTSIVAIVLAAIPVCLVLVPTISVRVIAIGTVIQVAVALLLLDWLRDQRRFNLLKWARSNEF